MPRLDPRPVLRALGPVVPLALFMAAGPILGAVVLVATAERWVDPLAGLGAGVSAPLVLLATVVLAGLCLIPTHASSLVSGFLFGAAPGMAIALAGSAGAALLGYHLLRFLAHERVRRLIEASPRAARVHRALLEHRPRTAALIALVRLSPVMPFAATNLLMASAGVGLREFLVGSIAGMTPRVVIVVLAGAGLARLDLSRASDARLAWIGGIATVLALVSISRIARRALVRVAS